MLRDGYVPLGGRAAGSRSTLLVGIAGPAAVAADSSRERTHAASRAPVPGADTVLAQTKAPAGLGAVLTPVTDLLNQALKNGQLTPEQAQTLADAVKAAIAQITAAAPAAPGTPSSAQQGGEGRAADAKDVQGDALAALQKAVDACSPRSPPVTPTRCCPRSPPSSAVWSTSSPRRCSAADCPPPTCRVCPPCRAFRRRSPRRR
ncbi:hypothetical protein [Streptomyces sp. NPDC102462]|uniref:hypothetical protein n=1 Tax=Streptomyces sp. NPDC102462 TaxID=3366178 RepID=UPI00382C206C